jgi:hypothetical protein
LGEQEVISVPNLLEKCDLPTELISPDQTSAVETSLAGSDIPQEPPITSAE